MEIINFISQNIWWLAICLFVVLILFGVWRANSAYDKYLAMLEKYKNIKAGVAVTFQNFAENISIRVFGGQIKFLLLPEDGTDGYYSPSTKTIAIKKSLASQASIASLAIVAHEAGHAMQHFQNPQILARYNRLNNVVKALGGFNYVIILCSIGLALFSSVMFALYGLGLLLVNFFVAVLLKFRTLHIEKNASALALKVLEQGNFVGADDFAKIKKFLAYAKSTYTADLLCAILGWTNLVRKTKYF